jgi:hypothetical protein
VLIELRLQYFLCSQALESPKCSWIGQIHPRAAGQRWESDETKTGQKPQDTAQHFGAGNVAAFQNEESQC